MTVKSDGTVLKKPEALVDDGTRASSVVLTMSEVTKCMVGRLAWGVIAARSVLIETSILVDSKLELDDCANVMVGATTTADVLSGSVNRKTDVLIDSKPKLGDCTSDALSVHAHVELVSVQKLVQTSNSRIA